MIDQIMQKVIDAARELTAGNDKLLNTPVEVRNLTPLEAIGAPGNWDYPLLRGKEILLQAKFRESLGQAFTSTPSPFEGTLKDVLALDLNAAGNRAIIIAVINALLRDRNLISKTVHCRNSDPEECGKQITAILKKEHNPQRIGIAGYQPALVSSLIDYFGPEKINVTDLGADNLNKNIKGVTITDGITETAKLIEESDLLLVTGSVFANNTAEPFYQASQKGKPVYFFWHNSCRHCPYSWLRTHLPAGNIKQYDWRLTFAQIKHNSIDSTCYSYSSFFRTSRLRKRG